MGTLPRRGKALGLATTGADLVKRWQTEEFSQQDFFSDTNRYENIITNPPYLLAEQIVAKALEKNVEGFIAIFVPIRFLASQGRKPLFQSPNMHSVVILSSRPSVPPGNAILQFGEAIRKSGSIDFCWCVWKQNHKAVPQIFWS
jgi:methylase of polypeptide subunit release factors